MEVQIVWDEKLEKHFKNYKLVSLFHKNIFKTEEDGNNEFYYEFIRFKTALSDLGTNKVCWANGKIFHNNIHIADIVGIFIVE